MLLSLLFVSLNVENSWRCPDVVSTEIVMRNQSRLLAAALATGLVIAVLSAIGKAEAADDPVLILEGRVTGHTLSLSRSEIEALGMQTIVTHTPWEDGVVIYEGVSLAALMQAIGAQGTNAYVVALNDYSTVVPLSDFERYGPILATRRNGAHMAVSEKGPFFIVYPFDERPELNRELYWSRSAWQVARIAVE